MKIETLEERIANRANERVQKNIKELELSIGVALCKFMDYPNGLHNYSGCTLAWPSTARAILTILASDSVRSGWPYSIWDREREKVRTELMNIMDEAQKALLARPPSDDDCKPEV